MALIGTVSGSNGTSITAISGSLIIADEPAVRFPNIGTGVKLFVSGAKGVDVDASSSVFGGDVFVSGALGLEEYLQLRVINNKRFPTATTASYIYTSGSTNDLYFTQFSGSFRNDVRLRWLEGTLSTGLLNGGVLSTENGTTTFSVTAGSGLIVAQNASITSDPYPIIDYVSWPAIVSASLVYSGTAQITYAAIDAAGALSQFSTSPTLAQFKDRIILGRILHQTGSVSNGAINSPAMAYAVAANTFDFIRPFGPLKVSGHVLAASGSTMGLTKTAGDSYSEGRNYAFDPSAPNTILAADDTALTESKIYYQYMSGSTTIIDTGIANAGYKFVTASLYNNGGTLAAVGNSEWTNQRVFWFPKSVNRALFIYFGTKKYGTLLEAVAGLLTEGFVEGDNTKGAAIYVGAVSVKGNELNLSDTTNVTISQGGLFRSAGGGGGGSVGTTPPGGLTTQVQFNDGGAFAGDAGLTYDKLTDSLTVAGNITGSNLSLTGDLAVVGGDITTTAVTFNLVTGSAITVNFAQSAAALSIGASSGRTTINNDLAIKTGTIIGAPGTGTNVMTLISSGNIITKIDTDNSAAGHRFAVQDWREIDQFSIGENGNAEISGSLFVTGSITTSGYLQSINSSGDEGGEIFLSKSVTNTTLTGGVTVDVWQNRLRMFEQGGSARGYYLDISKGGDSVTSDLFRGDPMFAFLNRRLLIAQVEDSAASGFFGMFPFDIATQVTNTTSVLGNSDATMGFTSLATANSCAAWRTTNTWARIGHTGRMRVRLVTGADITSQTITFGLGTGTTTTGAGNSYSFSPAESQILAVYNAGTANWLLLTKDGTTANTVDTGVAVVINTEYFIEIIFTASTVTLSVNGSTPVSSSTNLPAAGTSLYPRAGINPTTNAIRGMFISRMVFEAGQVTSY